MPDDFDAMWESVRSGQPVEDRAIENAAAAGLTPPAEDDFEQMWELARGGRLASPTDAATGDWQAGLKDAVTGGVPKGLQSLGLFAKETANRLASGVTIGDKPLWDYDREKYRKAREALAPTSTGEAIGKGVITAAPGIAASILAGPAVLPQIAAGALGGMIGEGAESSDIGNMGAGAVIGGTGAGLAGGAAHFVSKTLPRFLRGQAAKALGYARTPEEALMWQRGGDTVMDDIRPFRFWRGNEPEDLAARIRAKVDPALAEKRALLAGSLGDTPIDRGVVGRRMTAENEPLQVDFGSGTGPTTFAEAENPIAARGRATERFGKMQEDAALSRGDYTVVPTVIGKKTIRDTYGNVVEVDDIQDVIVPGSSLQAREGEKIRSAAMKSYDAARKADTLDATAGAASQQVGFGMMDELGSLNHPDAARFTRANRIATHGIEAEERAKEAALLNVIPTASGVPARAAAAGGRYGATLAAAASAMRSPGVAGRIVATGQPLLTAARPFRDPRPVVSFAELIAALSAQKERQRKAAEALRTAGTGVVAP